METLVPVLTVQILLTTIIMIIMSMRIMKMKKKQNNAKAFVKSSLPSLIEA